MEQLLKNWHDFFDGVSRFGYEEGLGTTRLSWSPEFDGAANFLAEKARAAGLQVHADSWGNEIFTIPGKNPQLPPVYTGSHLDSVPHGGKYDGMLGVTAPLAIAKAWLEEGFQPERTVTIIGFAEEEGTRFHMPTLGSKAITGELQGKSTDTFLTKEGKSLTSLLQEDSRHLTGDPLAPSLHSGKCYLELHIEQGRYLEDQGLPLGIVTAIVGIRHFYLTVNGTANHAGTTAMKDRHDALAAASHLITSIYQAALASNRAYVATVGQIQVEPGAQNVVPGQCSFTLEMRSEKDSIMDTAEATIREKIKEIEALSGVSFAMKPIDTIPPVPMNASLMELFQTKAHACGIPFQLQPSWAGHDAQIIGQHLPAAMLFVPSVKGISHAKEEYTRDEDIAKALQVLDQTLRQVASE